MDRVTVCGGGNAAHTLAGLLGSREDCEVRVYAPFEDEASRWQEGIRRFGGIRVHSPQRTVTGRPSVVTRDPGEAAAGAQIVLLALPAFAHESIFQKLGPHLAPGAWVGALPARGGFDLCARHTLKERFSSLAIFGFQTLPWACRIQSFGEQAAILGTKQQVDVSCWPPAQAELITSRLQELLSVRLNPIDSFLSLDLADTGQVIHPGIMYGLFHDWDGQPFAQPRLFYQGVDAHTAQVLEQMSAEIQAVRSALHAAYPELDLSAVRSVREWLLRSYSASIADSSTLQSSFVSNRSYAGLLAPMRRLRGGFVPDFQARYLSEDVPYNLVVTRGIAELAGIPTPVIDQVLTWAQERLGAQYLRSGRLQGADLASTRAPQRYGYTTLDAFLQTLQSPISSTSAG